MPKQKQLNVLVTGASGYVGSLCTARLARERARVASIVALDVRPPKEAIGGVEYLQADIRSADIAQALRERKIDTVLHLAALVNPSNKKGARELEYEIDVLGTRNILEASVAVGVRHFIFSSSGAAYGYHADNPAWISERDPLRGNEEFSYSRNKRLVEELLADFRTLHPELRQLIFRPGTILGENVTNAITNLFHKRFILGIGGSDSPFVFIWDQDVVNCLVQGALEGRQGIYNLAGDGALSLREIAHRLGKNYLSIPAGLLAAALAIGSKLRLTRYGPEMLNFLRYRPVLSNEKLKEDFGYRPELSSAEVFELYRKANF